jgi:hypothetical protein
LFIDSIAATETCKGEWGALLMRFPIFTSIKPPATAGDLSYLRECLDSWRAVGFAPVAVNGPSEIAALRRLDLPIEYATLPTDGKPRIGAILSVIRKSGVRFAGIVNSDCRILPYPNLVSNLNTGLDRTVLVGWRIDVGGHEQSTASFGFDAYFFDTAILPNDDAGYSIGGPWWDYWFPLACEVAGGKIETLTAPLLTHKVHPINYSSQQEIDGCLRFWNCLRNWYSDGRAIPGWPFQKAYDRYRSQTIWPEQLSEISDLVRPWIRRKAASISFLPPELAEIESMLRLHGQALVANTEIARSLHILQTETRQLRSGIVALRNFLSLRLPARLRFSAITIYRSKLRTRAKTLAAQLASVVGLVR